MDTDDKMKLLLDMLPHGSGINYDWKIEPHKRLPDTFYASNAFDAMNENGYYCHVYPFTLTLKFNGLQATEPCEICKGTGQRTLEDMQVFHPEMSLQGLKSWLYATNPGIEFVDDHTFACMYCHATGKHCVPEFSIVRFNWHGLRERACCGVFLHDTLEQILVESLEFYKWSVEAMQ